MTQCLWLFYPLEISPGLASDILCFQTHSRSQPLLLRSLSLNHAMLDFNLLLATPEGCSRLLLARSLAPLTVNVLYSHFHCARAQLAPVVVHLLLIRAIIGLSQSPLNYCFLPLIIFIVN